MTNDTERSTFTTPAGRAAQISDLDEQVVCGGPGDFMTVRRLRIRGTNFEIGRALGLVARDRYGQSADMYRTDPIYGRARRHYYQRNYPIHWERMRGVAAAFGIDPEDDAFDLSGLVYNTFWGGNIPVGCSTVSVPPSLTATGHGYLSRNLDFPPVSLADLLRFPLSPEDKAKQRPVFSEPYLMEWYPQDGGYASMAMQAGDLLSGTFDGMNSAGLVVAILADVEAMMMMGPNIEIHPVQHIRAIGLYENQVMRLLLDTCATVDEARETLLAIKDFYKFMPMIYTVADRTGRSFVYEHSIGRNAQYVIEGTGSPQLATNFLQHRHPASDPAFDAPLTPETDVFWRYRKLSDLVSAHGRPFTADDVKVLHAEVSLPRLFQNLRAATTAQSPGGVDAGSAMYFQNRTLWYSLYDQETGTVAYRFYLGDEMTDDGRLDARRSDYLTFTLEDFGSMVS
jgi:hypothetical protein